MIIDYKYLKQLYSEYKKDLTGGVKDSLLAVAAGYSLDFIDLARDNKIFLMLSSALEEQVPQAMTLVHFYTEALRILSRSLNFSRTALFLNHSSRISAIWLSPTVRTASSAASFCDMFCAVVWQRTPSTVS